MSESRRKFLKAGLMAALFAAVPLRSVFSQSFKERDGNPGETPPLQIDPLANYSKASFVSYLNSIFQIQTVNGVVAVTLARVDDMPAPKGGECFSLLFRGGNRELQQETYVLVHPSLGTFQMFLVPAGSDQNGAQAYLATLNRLSPADFAKMTAPSRISGGTQRNGSSGSSTGNSTSTGGSTTGGSTSTQTTGPAVTTTAVNSATTTVGPVTSGLKAAPTTRRKHKPIRKRVDSKSSIIN
jgi:hypothetical protein